MKVRRTKENMYAVIGLGRFGFALAQRLAESGAELIVVDKEESVINDATAFTDNAFLVNELTRENLSSLYLGLDLQLGFPFGQLGDHPVERS